MERVNTWGIRKTVGAIAVAAAVAGVGGAAIAAATDVGYHGMSGGMHGPGGPPPPPTAHHADVEPDSLHGEYVVSDGHGGFTTQVSQTGGVTAVSAASITVRSDDGFVQTYVVHEAGAATRPPFSVNDRVTVDATRDGQTATVTSIRLPLSPNH